MGQGDPGGQYQSGLDRSGRTEIPYFRSTESGKGRRPLRVKSVESTRPTSSQHVRFAPIASELSHRSNSTRCAIRRTPAVQQLSELSNHLVGKGEL